MKNEFCASKVKTLYPGMSLTRWPDIVILFPLRDANAVEIRVHRRVAKEDFERVRKLLALAEPALVEDVPERPVDEGV